MTEAPAGAAIAARCCCLHFPRHQQRPPLLPAAAASTFLVSVSPDFDTDLSSLSDNGLPPSSPSLLSLTDKPFHSQSSAYRTTVWYVNGWIYVCWLCSVGRGTRSLYCHVHRTTYLVKLPELVTGPPHYIGLLGTQLSHSLVPRDYLCTVASNEA